MIAAWRRRTPPFRTALVRAAKGLALIACGSCQSIHATVGLGMGIGADVQVSGILHAGAMVGAFSQAGRIYGDVPRTHAAYLSLGLMHFVQYAWKEVQREHLCFGLLPGLWSLQSERDHPWALEVGVALGVVAVRLGWDPLMPWSQGPHDDEETAGR